jgi:hypothetical protein
MQHTKFRDADGVEVGWASQNDGYKYIFVCLDVFSRYAWCIPMKSKDMGTSWDCLKAIVDMSGRTPEKIWVDQGSEFYNKIWKKNLADRGIVMYSTYGDHKVMIVERFNRSLKGWMYRRLTALNSARWVDIFNGIVAFYNNRKHSALGMSPTDASEASHEKALWKHQYGDQVRVSEDLKPKFRIGQFVRVARKKRLFERGFDPNWTDEVFVVCGVKLDEPVVYTLKEMPNSRDGGLVIEGSFYQSELKATDWQVGDTTFISKVLAVRGKGAKEEKLVSWVGWSSEFNRWMKSSDIGKV